MENNLKTTITVRGPKFCEVCKNTCREGSYRDAEGEEDADRILVTEVYVQDGENHWHPEEMSVWDWIGKLNDLVRWAEIKEQINRDS